MTTISEKIKRYLHHYYYKLLEFFDPSPKINENEPLVDYVFRIPKKYALRRLDLQLAIFPFVNITEAKKMIEAETDPEKKEFLQLMYDIGFKRLLYEMIRDAISIDKDYTDFIRMTGKNLKRYRRQKRAA